LKDKIKIICKILNNKTKTFFPNFRIYEERIRWMNERTNEWTNEAHYDIFFMYSNQNDRLFQKVDLNLSNYLNKKQQGIRATPKLK
jgi:hypothetical protein